MITVIPEIVRITIPFATSSTNTPLIARPVDAFSVGTDLGTTYHGIAQPLPLRMERHVSCSDKSPLALGKAEMGKGTAMRGMACPAVTNLLVGEEIIAVPSAATPHTLRSSVPLPRELLVVNTPFIPDEWERMLNDISPFNDFSDVPNSIRFGFDMGVHSPPTSTYTPPNHNSAIDYPDHVLSHIHKELSLRRYTGPFSRSRLEFLIGPFRTSPLGTVPKSFDTAERRIIQDLSFPRNDPSRSSVNSQINIDDFKCDWGTFNDVRLIVIDAPVGAEAATLDVDAAFRCCPIIPSQQQSFVIHWNGSFFIDHNAPFGATSASGVFGRVADAKSAILASRGLGPSKNGLMTSCFSDFLFPLLQLLLSFLTRYQTSMTSRNVSDGPGKSPRPGLLPPSSNTLVSCGTCQPRLLKFRKPRSCVTYPS